MSYPTFFLRDSRIAHNAAQFIAGLPTSADRPLVVEVKEPTRTLEQNAKLWAVLTDIADQVDWYGRRLSKEDWKTVLTAALKKLDVVPAIDGTGFVALGQSTSKMRIAEMAELIELAQAFGSEHGVRWGDESMSAMRWAKEKRAA
ncbi:recombination protein NinB [Chitiniphilus shinanonensis]|uniref:recombination protein NinB n=1 Tax=Chitiniphilus shinanonensis TaxID=553088 RepID=UPI0030679AE1